MSDASDSRASSAAAHVSQLWRDGLAIGLALVAVYFVLRLAGAPTTIILGWAAIACALAVASPIGGLTVLGAIGPYIEAQTANGDPTPVPFLLAAVGVGMLVALVRQRRVPPLPVAVLLALALMAGTALGVAHTWLSFGQERGISAIEGWVPGIGGGLTVLLASALVAWRGDRRLLAVVVGSVAIAAALSIVDMLSRGLVHSSVIGFMLRSSTIYRLTGVIPAPNASAAIFLVAAVVGTGTALFATDRRVRLAGLAAAVPGVLAVLLTFSRSGLLALGLAAAVFAWHWRPRIGIVALLVVGVAAAAVIAGVFGRGVPEAADQARLDAWGAAVRMWQAEPLFGHGFRSFEWLHTEFGSPLLDAPHNEWLRFFAEEGVAVGVIGLTFAVLVPVSILRSRTLAAVGAGTFAAAFALMASFNNPFLYSQVTVPAFALIGVGMGVLAARIAPAAGEIAESPVAQTPAAAT